MKNVSWAYKASTRHTFDGAPGRRVLWGRGPEKSAPLQLPDYSGLRLYSLFEESILDDGGGTYTGTAGDDIVYPSSIQRYLKQKLGSVTTGDITTGASTFGSYSQAKTDLDAKVSGEWEIILRHVDPDTISADEARISQQAPIAFWRSQWDGKFKAQVYKKTPNSWDYFLDPFGAAYSWSYREDVVAGSAIVGLTRPQDCVKEVHVRYSLYAPSGTFRGECYVGPTGSDNGSGTRDQNAAAPENREAMGAQADTNWKINGVMSVDCDMIYRAEQAVALRNFLFDRNSSPRIRVIFDSPHRPAGLEPNMVTKISDDWYDYRPPPKYPSGTSAKKWRDLLFFVAEPIRWRLTPQGVVYSIELEELT